MAATMSKILERLSALEAEVKSLKEENELLKMVVPLPAITESLRCADSAEIKEWMEACQAVAEKFGVPAAAAPAEVPTGQKKRGRPAKKDPSEKRAATNPGGPAEWNRYKSLVWREMAAGYGITEADEAKFKQLVKDYKKAHPEAVISYQEAMQEAKRRRCAEEGREYTAPAPKSAKAPAEKKPADAEKKAEKKTTAKKPAPPPADDESEVGDAEDFASQLKALGINRKTIDGEEYWVDQSNGEVFKILEGEEELGDRLGVYDADTDEIDITA
jgi:hypothetical protein